MKTVILALIGLVIIAGICVGGYWLNWQIRAQDSANQYTVNQNSQQYQSGLIAQERARVAGYAAAAEGPQKASIAQAFCAVIPDLSIVPNDIAIANTHICK